MNYSIPYKVRDWIYNDDKFDLMSLSSNPKAIHLLEANQDKINWDDLSRNPCAIHLLETNQDKIKKNVLQIALLNILKLKLLKLIREYLREDIMLYSEISGIFFLVIFSIVLFTVKSISF